MTKILGTLLIGLMLAIGGGGIVRAGPLEDIAKQPNDYANALRLWRRLAEEGNAAAQIRVGFMYASGSGVTQDYKEAAKWYRLAAEQGNTDAQVFLGRIYAEGGHGIERDYKEAAKWDRLAAEKGRGDAQSHLAEMYRRGEGVAKNSREAAKWDRLAAKQRSTGTQSIASATPLPTPRQGNQTPPSAVSIPMQSEGGIYVVPVLINDRITLDFVVDSGAADVSIPADVVLTLMRTGTLKEADFLGKKTYVLADGSEVPSQTFRIRSLKVGNKVLEDVRGSIASVKGSLLLGQSFLGRFKSWSVDNAKHALVLEAAE
jgi:TPR repeat protein